MAPKATEVHEVTQRDFAPTIEKTQKPLVVTPATVILDARSSFDFGLNHVQNSRSFSWKNLAENPRTAEPLRDKRKAAQQLALLGLRPDTPVIILGYGQAGHAEEGRLAWDLLSLGFQDVQVSGIDSFRKVMTPNATERVQNEKPWTPDPRTDLQIDKNHFLNLVSSAKSAGGTHIIDVRSAQEFGEPNQKNFGAVNIEWKQFYNAQGRPNTDIKKKLAALGVGENDPIILMCRSGVRSAAATYALTALGYSHARSLVGGLQSF
jgi:3-mercaptopyruvate sulfurtransferase SseA